MSILDPSRLRLPSPSISVKFQSWGTRHTLHTLKTYTPLTGNRRLKDLSDETNRTMWGGGGGGGGGMDRGGVSVTFSKPIKKKLASVDSKGDCLN